MTDSTDRTASRGTTRRPGRRPGRRPRRADDARGEGRPAREHLAGRRRRRRDGAHAGRRPGRADLGGGHRRRARPPDPPLRHRARSSRRAGAAARAPSSSAQVRAANRFGIPAQAHEECLTGLNAWGATIYPDAAVAGRRRSTRSSSSGWATQIGASMARLGIHQGLAPVLDVARDLRWGRVEETLGEDPYLVGTIGIGLRPRPAGRRRRRRPSSTSSATPPRAADATWRRCRWARASWPT